MVRNYLRGRVQRVQWGSCVSDPCVILVGVPQGRLLSPLLFVICINSLNSRLPSSVSPVKYADDLIIAKLLMGSLPGLTLKALDFVAEWRQEFSLAMNGARTMDMIISARREDNIPSPPPPTISGQTISRISTFKLLGVTISSDLSLDSHIRYMLTKAQPRIHYLSVAKRAGLHFDVLKQIHLTFICPVRDYASPVWWGLTKGLSEELERVQKRCCRIIGIPSSSLPSMSDRRDEATLSTLTNILKDSSSPLQSFLLVVSEATHSPRRRRKCTVSMSRSRRHELSCS